MAEGSYQKLQESGLDFLKVLGSTKGTAAEYDIEQNNKNYSIHNLDKLLILPKRGSVQSVTTSVDEIDLFVSQNVPIEVPETRSSGNVSKNTYFSYLAAGVNVYSACLLLLMCVIPQILASGVDYWLMFW